MALCTFCHLPDEVDMRRICQGGKATPQADLAEFLGDTVEIYMDSDDVVCGGCRKAFHKIAKLKMLIWRRINEKHAQVAGRSIKLFKLNGILTDILQELEETPVLGELYSTSFIPEIEARFEVESGLASLSGAEYLEKFVPGTRNRSNSTASGKRAISPAAEVPRKRSMSSLSQRRFSSLFDEDGKLLRKNTRSKPVNQGTEGDHVETELKCDIGKCTMFFQQYENWTEHKLKDHSNTVALYFCDECDKKYFERKHLKMHSFTHDNSFLYCFLCDKQCRNSDILQEHLREHVRTKEKIVCRYCDKTFVNNPDYRAHVKSKHKSKKEIIQKKPMSIIQMSFNKEDIKRPVTRSTKKKVFTVFDLSILE